MNSLSLRTERLAWLIAGCVLICRPLSGQTMPVTPLHPSPDAVVERILDKKQDMAARVAAYQQVFQLGDAQQRHVWQRVAQSSDDQYAPLAARDLIVHQGEGVGDLIRPAFSAWSAWAKNVVFGVIFARPDSIRKDPTLLKLVRDYIKDQKAWGPPLRSNEDPAETCAMILGRVAEEGDKPLLREAAGARPELVGVWLAIVQAAATDPDVLKLAKQICDSKDRNVNLRIAAAIAAGVGGDKKANDFALGEIDRLGKDFGGTTVAELLMLTHGKPLERDRYRLFRQTVSTLNWLRLINDPQAEVIAAKYLTAKNEFIRLSAGAAVAVRWPAKLLDATPRAFTAEEHERLLAIALYFHPGLKKAVEEKVLPKRMEELTELLRSTGPGGFLGPPGEWLGL